MRLLFSKDWLRKFDNLDEPEGCAACGAIAGCCDKYPDCAGNLKIPSRVACTAYKRPKGIMGGPCLNCGCSQPDHAKT